MSPTIAPCAAKARTTRIHLGILAPALLVVLCAADLALRFAPTRWFTFRAHEALVRFSLNDGPYVPNQTLFYPASYGDLSNLGNLRHLREYRPQTLSSDGYGYRNPRWIAASGRVEALLAGDSFSVGTGNSDSETLSAQVMALSGRAIYNMASQDHLPSAAEFATMADRLGMRGGVVIVQHLERKDTPARHGPESVPLWRSLQDRLWFSPLRILARRAHLYLQNDRVFPNLSAGRVVQRTLINGELMLFHPADLETFRRPRRPQARFWAELASDLKPHGLRLLVLLVPNKFTVYEPLLREREGVAPRSSLDVLEESLSKHGVPAINLRPLLTRQAASGLARGEYLYWRDDSHWNARGIRVAAEQIHF